MKKILIKKTITILIMLAVTSFSLLTGCVFLKDFTPIDRAIARRITTVTLPEASPQNVKLEGEFTEEQLEKFNEVYNLLLKMSIYDIDHEKMMEAIIAGMSSVFDAYTMYVPEEHAQSIRESSSGEYKGIGVTIVTPEDGIGAEVVSVNPTGDAYVKGVKPGDIIIKVEDMELTKSMSLEYIASMVKGEEGTYVNITIWRPSEEKEIQFNIMRMLINTIEVTGKMIEGTDIGHVYISSFSADMLDEFVDIFNDLVLKQGMKKLVLDLRDNPGGDFYAAVSLADAFIEEGVITTLADGTGYEEEYTSDSYAVSIPTVILVNENSASASELFSGAMKHYGLATIVGTQTFGKGVAQSIYDLDDGSQLRVTSYQFLLPDDTCIDGIGITPDVEVLPFEGYEDAYVDSLELEHDAQLQKAIEILESK
ncbi:MAG TPA: S41 family peptidase [Clostridia bacterium]|nr:S41 family peptidase [Clostridiaceae bacterium]HOF26757.1 S41 family peptidase [Clostridia bacterium]HOR89032.1 S41 family peptidase [Clostridia bacterium]HPL08721.1 S41 family peptidase [Clostridia bacterium]